MMLEPRGAQAHGRSRLARVFGPEVVAAICSVALVVGVVAVAVARPGGSIGGSSAPNGASLPPDAAASGDPGVASPSPSPVPWATAARVLIDVDTGLAGDRDRLADALADGVATNELARALRAMNTTLTATLDRIDGLEAEGAPPELVGDLRSLHQEALTVSLETLQASLQNADAYEAGAGDVVDILADLDVLIERTAAAAGLP